jgi:hypothetical protein
MKHSTIKNSPETDINFFVSLMRCGFDITEAFLLAYSNTMYINKKTPKSIITLMTIIHILENEKNICLKNNDYIQVIKFENLIKKNKVKLNPMLKDFINKIMVGEIK